MIGPVILPLEAAVSAVASENQLAHSTEGVARLMTHTHVYNIVRDGSGTLIAGHVSHASHASHSSHVSSAGGGGGGSGGGGSTYTPPAPPVYHAPAAPSTVSATPGNGSATVSWGAVATDDGSMVKYIVTVNPGGVAMTVTGVTSATITGLQNGTAYTFVVVAANSVGQSPASVASGTIVPLAPQLDSQVPIIKGKAAVGETLKVETPGWAAGTTFTYQWLADGVGIPDAGGTELVVTPDLLGKRISVTVAGTNPGYAKGASATSAKTPKVVVAPVPRIVGKPSVGTTLRVTGDKWASGTKLTFAWYVDGKKVPNDSGPALLLNSRHVGKTVTVKVTGSKSGYTTMTRTSSPTSQVRR